MEKLSLLEALEMIANWYSKMKLLDELREAKNENVYFDLYNIDF